MSKTKVLHAVASMECGGIQTWLVDLVKEAQNSNVQIDILTYAEENGPLAQKVREFGCKVFFCPNHHNLWTLFQVLKKINEEHGPYNAIHAHNSFQNGIVLLFAKLLRIPVRISHSHNSAMMKNESFPRRIYNAGMKRLLPFVATHLTAVSNLAGKKLYGTAWSKNKRCSLLYCGVRFDAYDPTRQPFPSLRQELSLPETAKVVGHVGRFTYEKNHAFLLDVIANVMSTDQAVWLVLVGDGALRPSIEEKTRELGIADRTLFTGTRNDIPRVLIEGFDLFLMPSLAEGLPLVMLEAQGAGRKILVSDAVTKEADIMPEMVSYLALEAGTVRWASMVRELLNTDPPLTHKQAYDVAQKSPFSIRESFQNCLSLWKETDRGMGG